MRLLIDTTQRGQMIFEIWQGRGKPVSFRRQTETLSEDILVELKKVLEIQKIPLKRIDKIFVNPGPGAFSSTRTGVAVANALSLALGIPMAEWPTGKIKEVVLPKYDKAPNITKPK